MSQRLVGFITGAPAAGTAAVISASVVKTDKIVSVVALPNATDAGQFFFVNPSIDGQIIQLPGGPAATLNVPVIALLA